MGFLRDCIIDVMKKDRNNVSTVLKMIGLDGGEGSGNFGHKGRPGMVGGSGEGGGSGSAKEKREQHLPLFGGLEKKGIRIKEIKEPQRPNADDYGGYTEEYYKAREAYKTEREEYKKKVHEWIDEQIPKEPISRDDLDKWAQNNNVKIGNIDELDMRLAKAWSERYEKLIEAFPEVNDYFRVKGEAYNTEKQPTLNVDASKSYLAYANNGMTFCGYSAKDMELFCMYQFENVSDNTTVEGDGTVNTVFDHEFGHNLFDYIRNKVGYYPPDDYSKLTPAEMMIDKKKADEYHKKRVEIESDFMQNVFGKSGCSQYSYRNMDEAAAEGFAAWNGGEETEFAKAFGEFLWRWID